MFINMFLWFCGVFLQILGVFRYVIEHENPKSKVGEGGEFVRNFRPFQHAYQTIGQKKGATLCSNLC